MTTDDLVGASKKMRDLLSEADCIAATNSKILITGERGVGKDVLARYIHQHSRRSAKPFITVNCAGVPETLLESELFGHVRGSFAGARRDRLGLLEMARGGTVFLEEIGELSMRLQTLLLRFLERHEIQPVGSDETHQVPDVRLIAATSRDLSYDIRRQLFREDLYYRLNVVHLIVPALRERSEDIKPLLEHFLLLSSESTGRPPCRLRSNAVTQLEAYPWPGNLQELRNVVERLAGRFSGRDVAAWDLPRYMAQPPGSAGATAPDSAASVVANQRFERITRDDESFWTVVFEPFMKHDITRDTLRTIVRRGLEQTHGNYGALTRLFNMPPTDYERFLSFLQKYDCLTLLKRYRISPAAEGVREPSEEGSHRLRRLKILQFVDFREPAEQSALPAAHAEAARG